MTSLKERWNASPGLRAALSSWLLARVLVFVALILAYIVTDLYIDPPCTQTGCFDADTTSFWSTVWGPNVGLMSWDSDWYLQIARGGYDAVMPEGIRYFPLWPLIGRGVGWVVGSPLAAMLLVANACAILLGVLIYRICIMEGRNEKVATRAAWLVALAPPAFVLTMAYSEALAMSLAVAGFMAVRKGRWGWAAVVGVVAGLLRPTGLFLMIPFAIEALRGWKERSAGEGLLRVGAVFAPIVGVGIYLAWAGAAFDDPFGPFDVQQESGGRGAISNPVSTLIGAARSVFTDHHYHHGLHFIWALFFLALCVPLFRRWPISYGAFALVNIFQAIGTANLNSLERYGFAAFPLLLVVAEWSTESPVRSRAVVAISSVAMVMYATASFVSGYVP